MRECCEAQEGLETIERWLADGYWSIYDEVTGYIERHATQRNDYFKKAAARVFDLACWYFSGRSPFWPETTLDPI